MAQTRLSASGRWHLREENLAGESVGYRAILAMERQGVHPSRKRFGRAREAADYRFRLLARLARLKEADREAKRAEELLAQESALTE